MKKPCTSLHLVLPAITLLLQGSTAQAIIFANDTAISFNNTNYEGLDIVVTNCTLTVDGVHSFASLQVLNGGNVTHTSYDFLGTPVAAGLNLAVTGSILVAAGGGIAADGKGYGSGAGPGGGTSSGSPASGSGAGHGGYGGESAALDGYGQTYDAIAQPIQPGCGGGASYAGAGGAGGGSIRLVALGAMLVDGRLSANGANGMAERSGGGSGGSIWLSAQTFAGMGLVSANGGAGEPSQGGGGGGGRISLQYASNAYFGKTSALGGSGFVRGGAGTIYTRANSQSNGQVLVDNGGNAGAATALPTAEVVDLTAQAGAVVSLNTYQTFGNLLIGSNAWISLSQQQQAATLTVTNNATILEGGGISADGTGGAPGSGAGAGKAIGIPTGGVGGGGGYGGYGAAGAAPAGYSAAGGGSYGSVMEPVSLGSGGGTYPVYSIGGAGGGAVHLIVTGMLLLEGTITANGSPGLSGGGGGGSGGSIWLTVGTLAGWGTVSANGGNGSGLGLGSGGGGGGGRIAIQYGGDLFFGVTSALGGSGATWGGAGTIYTRANSQTWGQVLLDNGGQSGTNTGWSGAAIVDLTVRGGAVAALLTPTTFGNLLVASNGWLRVTNQIMTVVSNATVQAGGGIIADRAGYAAGLGLGGGRSAYSSSAYIGGGGGYGGYGAAGGAASPLSAYGGSPYGSVSAPIDLGSGGGGSSSPAIGGAGGGAVRLSVTGVLQVDGTISAAGGAGTSPSGGGGSGGTIALMAGTITGGGIISANGGMGSFLGGGGGGGRIAISYGSYNFYGLTTAYGGGGYAAGGAGTIYSKANSQQVGAVLLDNGGQAGTNTVWASSVAVDVTVRGGAQFDAMENERARNLIVASNGWVVFGARQAQVQPFGGILTVTGDATIQAGGGIIADGNGYPAGQGPGAGKVSKGVSGIVASGGGYGGSGGSSGGSAPAPGGFNYGAPTNPETAGSGGGIYQNQLYSGAGGGIIRLIVSGTLLVDGRISAVGLGTLSPNFGGGAGGSIYVTAGTLTGAGVISADGGAGGGLGGGGGGGRIALLCANNTFGGGLSAHGGSGYMAGGAGTIYSKANTQPWGQLVIDNNGLAGTNTSLAQMGTVDLNVRGGAVVVLSTSQTFGNLLIASGGWISLSNQQIIVTGNATIQSGGGIIADGQGYAGGIGPGAGRYVNSSSFGNLGGGGGHGGDGASSGGTPSAGGGGTYGAVNGKTEFGSGGGGNSPGAAGGAGGGAIWMTVSGVLALNGRVSANGGAGIGQGTGGGSGGSVLLTAGTLTGAGIISANGGAGNLLGGGGGGGWVALYGVNAFGGTISAYGGGGYAWGGAGTIYTKANSQATGQMLVDNGGHFGTNTPLPNLSPFDLTVRAGAIAYPAGPYLILSNLFIDAGGALTCLKTRTNLDLTVLRDATIEAGGTVSVDGDGFAGGTGPGAGLSTNFIGSGAGYGGKGGASTALPGGPIYGSVQQPVDRGSGGGFGYGGTTVGSEGGGAIRFNVGGTLMLNGLLSAEGKSGLQDDAGGGSGGSIWVMAGALTGTGTIAAEGGAGELYQGGGGGGGRVAIYTPVNAFAGLVSAAGGTGVSAGQIGSIYRSSIIATPAVVSATPTGTIAAGVSTAQILFSTAVISSSVAPANVSLTAPGGGLVSPLAIAALNLYCFQISFPAQNAQGNYVLTVGPQVQDLLGRPMAQAYTGTFSVVWAAVQGKVSDTNGQPVPGVLVQVDNGVPSTTTDASGNYVFSVSPAGITHVTPTKPGLVFVPSVRAYANVTLSLSNENYLAASTVAPALVGQFQGGSLFLNWHGYPGVTYQPFYSTNLVDWLPYGGALPGADSQLQLVVPLDLGPRKFFRVGASY